MYFFINLNQAPQSEFIMNAIRPSMPPFGVAYIAAVLHTIGVESFLFDDNLHGLNDQQLRELLKKHKEKIQVIGLTSITTTFEQIKRVSRIAKEEMPDIPVIVGGPHARLLPDDIINIPTVDVVFTSEAELAMIDYAKGKPLSEIGNVVFKKDGQIIKNQTGMVIENLDEIPFPAYDLFRISDYHATRVTTKRHPNSYVITSRGCPYDCTFCSSKALNPTQGKKIRFRSPGNVLEEIEFIVRDYGVKEIFFSDEMFTCSKSHLIGICEGLIKKRLNLIWMCQTRAEHVNKEMITIMKKAGCHQICFGVESGDPYIRKVINKELDVEKVKVAIKLNREVGIESRCSFMFGNQFETPQTMQKTIDLALALRPDFASFNIATPYPGTELRAWAVKNGYLVNSEYKALDSTAYVMKTPDLPPGTVEYYTNKAFREFYYNPGYLLRRIININGLDELVRLLKSISFASKSFPKMIKALCCRQRKNKK